MSAIAENKTQTQSSQHMLPTVRFMQKYEFTFSLTLRSTTPIHKHTFSDLSLTIVQTQVRCIYLFEVQ